MAPQHRRGMALYVAVVATTMIVSVLTLTATAVVRLERKQAVAIENRLIARSNARSAVELALADLNSNSNWRTAYGNNVESLPRYLGANGRGSLSWKLADIDGSLTNADAKLWLKGIGRIGETVQVSGVQVQAGAIGPGVLRSRDDLLGNSTDDLKNDKWYGQYFKASLPANANGWRISSVEVYARRSSSGRNVIARLYRNSINAGNLLETVNLVSDGFPSGSFSFYPISFSGTAWLNTSDAIIFTIETSSSTVPFQLQYRSGGVSEANSAFVRGSPAWGSFETDKALRYRANGYYTTPAGVAAIAATWTWDAP